MLKVFFKLFFLTSLLSTTGGVFALGMPFTDIRSSDPYFEAVGELYTNRVISDNGDHLFRPTDLMNRDFFVSLAVGIGCHECETPSIEDIFKYQISPFVDLPKTNRYYYCTAYAKDINIIQGYIPDTTGQATCEDQKKYMSSPFCSENTISRIEAAAILLRRAKLWDDTLNSGIFDKSSPITDTTPYWYGYAKKGIEIAIIKQKSDTTIGQDEKITRGEFAIMAARILRYTQCQISGNGNSSASAIGVKDSGGNLVQKSGFASGEVFSLVPITTSGTWDYAWKATNSANGATLSGNGNVFPGEKFGNSGNWFVTLDVIDPATKKVVSQPTTTISIGGARNGIDPCILLSSNPLSAATGFSFSYIATPCADTNNKKYTWDYGDGTSSSVIGNTNHSYSEPGIYTVTLTVTDQNTGKTGQASIIISVSGDKDTDGDGILDSNDRCPLVYAKTETGCPLIVLHNNDNEDIKNGDNSDTSAGIEANIGIQDKNALAIKKTNFLIGEEFSLFPIARAGTWEYSWQAMNIKTGNITNGAGNIFSGNLLGIGDSLVILNVIDPSTKKILASPSITITIQSSDSKTVGDTPCIRIEADPIRIRPNTTINLISITCNKNNDPLTYKWDFGDGTSSNVYPDASHKYTTPGIYTITLNIKNEKTGKTGKAKVLISVGTSILGDTSSSGDKKTENSCLTKYLRTQGLITGTPNCTQCPCNNSISIDSPLRPCDIVFPTILSPKLDTVYARGGFYLIP